jgi:protein-S-isoprenylcysteine O-methyltransferase Ste14
MEQPSKRKWKKYEFGGPAGVALMMAGLPAAVYYLYYCVRFNGGSIVPGNFSDFRPFTGFLDSITPNPAAAAVFLGWMALQAFLQAVLPGKKQEGTALAGGMRLEYRMNGLLSFTLVFALLGALYCSGLIDPSFVYDNFGALASSAFIFVILLSVFLYRYGKKTAPQEERSGSPVYDFFMGAALNPRVPPVTGFDLKIFCEARPGLMGWLAINLCFMYVQYARLGHVTAPMVLVNAFQFLYVADYFWNEPAILTTTDIAHERFGYMLAFGDLVWVPFTYTLQSFYLIGHGHDLPAWGIALITLLNAAGYYIFRAVNLQKHNFRTDPSGKIWGRDPEYIRTARGNLLLVSGFWGLSRHFNYVGDIMMAVAWCLPCLFGSPLPYFYAVYFTALLVHRERRDNKNCSIKYGADWDEYARRVRWRIIPYVY